MIVSFLHDFIFIKTRKTGGTSAEIVLSSWCGPDDICTLIAPEDELLRSRYGGSARNHSGDRGLEARHLAAVRSGDLAAVRRAYKEIQDGASLHPAIQRRDLGAALRRLKVKLSGRPVYRKHMRAAAMKRALPSEFWDRAHKLTLDRHPYEKVVSMAYWFRYRHPRLAREPFERTLDELVQSGRYANYPLYMKDGKLLVDEVIRTEEMWTGIAALGTRIGRKLPDPLPRAKSTHRTDQRPAREILTTAQRQRIAQVCAVEFDLLGYER